MNRARAVLAGRSRLHLHAGDCGAGRNSQTTLTRHRLAWIVLTAGLCVCSCAVNQATGERHLDLYGEAQEIEMGRQADSQITASLGVYSSTTLQSYAQKLGVELAKTSERPTLPWTFRVIDDPVVNAFALPGGFIYVTRGLMTYVENEAQLAAVVGHEIGHVTAQHTVHSLSTQQMTQLGLALGMIIKPELQQFGALVNAGLGLLYLKFSRDDESEADHLGLRYTVRAKQDPRQMIKVFDMLTRVGLAGGGGRVPEWLATHPNPETRSADIQAELDTLKVDLSSFTVNQASYLGLIDGMVFGENPRDGFFRENHFYQPQMQFSFDFPSGWQTLNQREAVIAISSAQDAIVELTQAQGSSSEAAQRFFAQEGLQAERLETGAINGLPAVAAVFRAQTEQGVVQGKAAFVEYKGATYQLLGYTTEALWAKYQGSIAAALASFRALTDPALLQVQPMHLKMLTVATPSTLAQLASQQGSPVSLETLAIINQVEESASFNNGDRVKMVIGEKPPAP